MTEEQAVKILEAVNTPFYTDGGFWIGTILGLLGLGFSVLAFIEARAAKNAAHESGRTVKIQTITIELSEIAQRLDKLDFNLSFFEARDLLNEISRRLIRLTAPFAQNPDISDSCKRLRVALDEAKLALEQIHPQAAATTELPQNAVYFATQGHFSNISGLVAEIMGLFEKRTIEVGLK